ncbi:hypothetical protein F5Y15DRAFT_187501 [Xylariaceae sp. FL0016]|nr:hypothetical protein F5Y15DRAFT_187501 [Xylariaceae sp. FL0016]
MPSSTSSPSPIPAPYRILFTIIEPLFATLGALQSLLTPSLLASTTHPSITYTPALRPLFTQSAGAWLMLAFHDAFTLRAPAYARDLRLWRHVLAAALLSDVGYTAGLVQSMGPRLFADPRRWDAASGITVVTTVVPMLAKVAFLAGVGLREEGRVAEGERAEEDRKTR